MLRQILPLMLSALLLSACTEVQFASHVAKKAMGTTSSGAYAPSGVTQQGTFKVGKPYTVMGQTYYPKETYEHTETGIASWYGPGFQGKRTASGERFDTNELTAAHRTLQMPSLVRVTNLDNGRSVIVRVNDRGPFKRGRVIDVSEKAAELLGFKGIGTAKVKLDVLPEESMQIAEMARRGENTRGIELAANRGQMPGIVPASTSSNIEIASADPMQGPALGDIGPVSAEALAPVQGHTSTDGRFMPDPVVTQVPVTKTNIYVQAGSFALADNAQRMSQTLGHIGPASVYPSYVNGKQFYRVRIGPVPNVEHADRVLNQVIAMGNSSALIVVD